MQRSWRIDNKVTGFFNVTTTLIFGVDDPMLVRKVGDAEQDDGKPALTDARPRADVPPVFFSCVLARKGFRDR